MLSLGGMVTFLLYLLVFCLVIALVWWAGNAVIGLLPPPIQQIARVILIVVVAIVCIGALLSLINGGIGIHPLFGTGVRVGALAMLTG